MLLYLFLASLAAGLLIGVHAMLFGVERASARLRSPTDISARISLPTIGGFLALFGLIGWILSRATSLSPWLRLAVALVSGGFGVAFVLLLIARWAVPAARREVLDERYLLQGHLARVTDSISADDAGAIVYDVDGTPHSVPARSLDAVSLPAGSEVVIERVEDGVAWVEGWERVEQRL